ncbi:MAG: hypothetical protein NW208_05610 [Bryobacter sp.]|nr:hypothetical protein [Bryobacter sp.]
MNSTFTPQPITYSITAVKTYGVRTVMELRQRYPWADYTLLLSQSNKGLAFEGYQYNGVTMWNAEPAPLFRTDVSVGQSWSTPLGPITLRSKSATITGQGRTFTGVHLYDVGSPAQTWGFAPNFGLVYFDVVGLKFTWTGGVANASVTPTLDRSPRVCPVAGVASVPEDASLSDAQREGALQLGMSIGSRNLVVAAPWYELEPQGGTYNLTRIDKELKLAAKHNLEAVFTLRVPQSVAPALPNYLSGAPLNSSQVLGRLDALLTRVVPLLNSSVKWVNIGYEVDTYFNLNPNAAPAFQTFFQAARAKIKALRPGTSVGIVFNFDGTRSKDLYYRALAPLADHVSFTYYAIMGDFVQRDAASPLFDIPLMVSYAGGKPLLLLEMGYSSAWAGQPAQAQFLANAYSALRKAGGSIPLFAVWSYRDLPASKLALVQMIFGSTSANFNNFMLSTGIVDANNVSKIAFLTVQAESPGFNAAGTNCTAN